MLQTLPPPRFHGQRLHSPRRPRTDQGDLRGIVASHSPAWSPAAADGLHVGVELGHIRADVHAYNTESEVNRLVVALNDATRHTPAPYPVG